MAPQRPLPGGGAIERASSASPILTARLDARRLPATPAGSRHRTSLDQFPSTNTRADDMTPVYRSLFTVHAAWCAALLLASPAQAQVPSAPAQVPAATTANLKLIFDSTYFDTQRFGPARWIEDGTAYTTVGTLHRDEARPRHRPLRHEDRCAQHSRPRRRASFRRATRCRSRIADYTWSADAKQPPHLHQHREGLAPEHPGRLLGARPHHRRRCSKLGSQAPKSSLMYAKFSPQGDRVAYVPRETSTSSASPTSRSPGSPPAPTRCTSTA